MKWVALCVPHGAGQSSFPEAISKSRHVAGSHWHQGQVYNLEFWEIAGRQISLSRNWVYIKYLPIINAIKRLPSVEPLPLVATRKIQLLPERRTNLTCVTQLMVKDKILEMRRWLVSNLSLDLGFGGEAWNPPNSRSRVGPTKI